MGEESGPGGGGLACEMGLFSQHFISLFLFLKFLLEYGFFNIFIGV